MTAAQWEELQHPASQNLINPFLSYADRSRSRGADVEWQLPGTTQTGTANDGYLITRSGLGKLLYIQLCEKRNFFSEYFIIMSILFQRLLNARERIWKEGVALTLIGLVYGVAHLSTWNNRFPTNLELWMWRSCVIFTAGSMGAFVLSIYLKGFLSTFQHQKLNHYYSIACSVCVGLGLFPVLIARMFLLVECFIVLRRIPADTYQTVAWTETWPHFN